MVAVSAGLVLAALPLFMVGGLAVQIKDEFGFTEAALGAGVTIGFLVGALTAPFGGRFADRVGPRRSIYVGSSLSLASLAGLGLLTDGWGAMVAFLCLAGVGVAIIDPGLAILVDRAIPVGRQGLAFGVKEASIPASTLAAGIAVPAIALTVGWRWSFAIGLLPWLVIIALLPRIDVKPRPSPKVDGGRNAVSPPRRWALLLVTAAGGLGTAAATGVGIFLTDSAVSIGLSPAGAGMLLATGSVAGIIARVGTGVVADRRGGPQFKLIAVMLAVGAATMAIGGAGSIGLLILGTIGAFAGGWAWTGLYFLSLVKIYPDRPGTVVGFATAGLGMGNATGPLMFGVVASQFSFRAAWLAAAVAAGLAAVLMATARTRF
jgi:MFS family permease